jgi:hypothetical protein
VQGGGISVAARTTLILSDGGPQEVLTVPGFGEVVGGCGSGGGIIGFVNHSGHDLRVFPFSGTDLASTVALRWSQIPRGLIAWDNHGATE